MVRGPILAPRRPLPFSAHIDFARGKDVCDLRSTAFTNVTTHEIDVNPRALPATERAWFITKVPFG